MNYSDLGCRRLACAIVEDAVKEYRKLGKSIKKNNAFDGALRAEGLHGGYRVFNAIRNENDDARSKMEVIRVFFRSTRFANLAPQLDQQAVIEACDNCIDKYVPDPKEVRKFVKTYLNRCGLGKKG